MFAFSMSLSGVCMPAPSKFQWFNYRGFRTIVILPFAGVA